MRVIVVDDEPEITLILADHLADLGVSPLIATSSAQAWTMINQQPVDLAIIDLLMPRTSGLDLVAQIRAADFIFPIVIMSGSFPADIATQVWQLSIHAFLEKPMSPDMLKLLIESVKNGSALEAGEEGIWDIAGKKISS